MRAVLIFSLFLLTGCVTGTNPGAVAASSRAQLGEEFSLTLGDSISLEGTPYTLVFERVIEDSRCPIGATCVWEGNARIEILLRDFATYKDGGKLAVEVMDLPVQLNTSRRVADPTHGTGLFLELRRLEPMPRADTPTQSYVATLYAGKP